MQKYYDLLGVNRSSSLADIKKAFHKLAHIHHPDKGGNVAKFKEISEAYSYLMNNHSPIKQHEEPAHTYSQNPNGSSFYYQAYRNHNDFVNIIRQWEEQIKRQQQDTERAREDEIKLKRARDMFRTGNWKP